jgi:tRNA G18 (ribose-2'-O)-methylase SpoU
MNGIAVDALTLAGPVALVVGNEGAGLRDATRARLTQLVSIPMRGQTESLNVAVAASILLYEFTRRR